MTSVAPSSVNVSGPQWQGQVMSGAGNFAPGGSLHRYLTTNKLTVDELLLVEDAPTTAGTASIQVPVDGFVLRLAAPLVAPKVGSRYSAPIGAARFLLQATMDGQGYYVQAQNSTTMQFYTVAPGVGLCPTSVPGCLVSRPFAVEYVDAFGGSWDLDIGAATWRP